MAYVPEVNPNTFLLFFEKGDSGASYSLRDYSVLDRVAERRAKELPWTGAEIRRMARYLFDAPAIDTNNLAFWHAYTVEGNEFLRRAGVLPADGGAASLPAAPPEQPASAGRTYPILNAGLLQALPKWGKGRDIARMLHSPQSEDWVTWNLLNLLGAQYPEQWWAHVTAVARRGNPGLELPGPPGGALELDFWRRVPAPAAYEAASRVRMRASGIPALLDRTRDPQPVEGPSEIDVIFRAPRFVVFAEAKLGADVELGTTYDPSRNQIARNIDCLLEHAAGRTPFFWMLVRDTGPARAYVQLMNAYRTDPRTLARDLPHRDPVGLARIARNLTFLAWRDLGEILWAACPGDDDRVRSIKAELERRVL